MDRFLAARCLVGLLLAAGCGGDDDGGGADASRSIDAMVAGGNHLGELCSDADPCPAEHNCVFLNAGNPDLGYCSPICATDDDCRDGYTGPASGMLSCFVPDMPDSCTIVCGTGADCPGELACVATGGPVSVCTTE